MSKEKKKSIIFTSTLAVIALALLAIFAFMSLRNSGAIGSLDSSEVMKEFNKNYNSKEKTVIYYASPDCGYCSLQTPILETISEDYDMDYYYLDSTKLSASQRKVVLEKLGMKSHATPATIVVKNGKVIDSNVGYLPGKEYTEFLANAGMIPEDAEYSAEKYITFIDYNKYTDMISSQGTNVIVVGQTTCSHCIAFKPAINTVAKDYDITINYLNLTDLSEDESNSFFESLKKIEYNDPDFVENGSFGTPLTLIVKDGKVKDYISGERTISQLVKQLKKAGIISE